MATKPECREVRGRIHEYLDEEIGEHARAQCEKHIAGCDACRSLVGEVRSVKAVLSREAVRRGAPPSLAVRIREGLDGPARRPIWRSFPSIFARRPVAVAAGVAVVLVVLFAGPLDHKGYVVAREVTRGCFEGHGSCARSTLLSQHVFTRNPDELERALTARTGQGIVVPDLSDLGLRLVEGHICAVHGTPAVHVYYERADGQRVSLFRVSGISEAGALGNRLDLGVEAYVPPADCWKNEAEKGMHVVMWRGKKDCLSILLGPVSEPVIERMVMSCVAEENAATL